MTTPYVGQPGGTGPYPLQGLPAPPPPVPVWAKVATTGPAGVALIDGTQTILSWTAPDDGQLHQFNVIGALEVTAAETGGTIITSYTQPDGATATPALFAAAQGVGTTGNVNNRLIPGGTTISVQQSSALTAGASVLYCEIWGS